LFTWLAMGGSVLGGSQKGAWASGTLWVFSMSDRAEGRKEILPSGLGSGPGGLVLLLSGLSSICLLQNLAAKVALYVLCWYLSILLMRLSRSDGSTVCWRTMYHLMCHGEMTDFML
jgi:hypothetical protein